MCGISGIIYNNPSRKNYSHEISEMNRRVHHRGPDDSGIYVTPDFAFGHTRLSIIDLSSAGHQPMTYMDRYVITYNGEVYNYLEIKKDLERKGYKFSNLSDTEVILAAYDYWQDEVVSKLNGMFAFAIYDMREKKCFLARDRTGVKPLYYYESEDEFYFFSEPKQVLLSNIVKSEPNERSINQYLAFQFALSDATLFKGIKKLLPGHQIIIQNREKIIRQYWSVDNINIDSKITYRKAQSEIHRLVDDAVRLRLRSDVSIGAYLSGGIDSNVVASIASQHVNGLNTYTFTAKKYPKTDESHLAKTSSEFLKSNHHEIELDLSSILDIWQKAIYYMDEPEVGYSLISQMAISKKVSQNIKVVLGGQGGDELFYGYSWHTMLALSSKFLSDIPFLSKIKIYIEYFRKQPLRAVRTLFNALKCNLINIPDQYFSFWRSTGLFDLLRDKSVKKDFFNTLHFKGDLLSIKKFEYKYWLQALLHVEDRSSMFASLESRVPLIDYRIAEYVFRLKPEYMIDGVLNKKILIDSYKKFFSPDILNNNQKKGYSSPIEHWFENEKVSKYIENILNNPSSYIYKFIDFNKVKKLNKRQIWMIISLEIWYKIFITQELKID